MDPSADRSHSSWPSPCHWQVLAVEQISHHGLEAGTVRYRPVHAYGADTHARYLLLVVNLWAQPVSPAGVEVRANAKSRPGQGGGQNLGVASNPVVQQANGHVRANILLNRAHHVQEGLAQDVHHGRDVALHHRASGSLVLLRRQTRPVA